MVCRDTLRIKHLPKELTEAQKEDFVRHFGALKVKVVTSKAKAKSVVYAKFENDDVAKNVMSRLHQISILNCRLCVEYAESDILQGQLTVQRVDDLREGPDKRFFKNFINNINAFNDSVGFYQPPPSHLKYNYPKANRSTINNIAHALATVPRFYTQVLHLMNKMSLPPPFAMPEPPVRTIPGGQQTQPPVAVQIPEPVSEKRKAPSSSESEMESDHETSKNKEIIPEKKAVQKKTLKRPKFIKQPTVQPSVNSKPIEKTEDVFEKVEVIQSQRKIELKVIQDPVPEKLNKAKTQEKHTLPEKKIEPLPLRIPTSKTPPPSTKHSLNKSRDKPLDKPLYKPLDKLSENILKTPSLTPKKAAQVSPIPEIKKLQEKTSIKVVHLDKPEYKPNSKDLDSKKAVEKETLVVKEQPKNQIQQDKQPKKPMQKNIKATTDTKELKLQKEHDILDDIPHKSYMNKEQKPLETPNKAESSAPAIDRLKTEGVLTSQAQVDISSDQEYRDGDRDQKLVEKLKRNQSNIQRIESTPQKLVISNVQKYRDQKVLEESNRGESIIQRMESESQKPDTEIKIEVKQTITQGSEVNQPCIQQLESVIMNQEITEPPPETASSEDDFPCISLEELAANQVTDLSVMSVFKKYNAGEPTNKLYIKNCAKTVVVQDLEYIYNRYREEPPGGRPIEFNIRLMQEGRMKGQAFVTLDSVEQAQKAVKETNGFILKDKPLVVVFGKAGKKK